MTPSPVAAEKRRVIVTKEQILAMPPEKRQKVLELLRQKAARQDAQAAVASKSNSSSLPVTPKVRTPQAWEKYDCDSTRCSECL